MKSFLLSLLRFCCYDAEYGRRRGEDVETTWYSGGPVLPFTVYMGMCGFKEYGILSSVLVRNSVSILAVIFWSH